MLTEVAQDGIEAEVEEQEKEEATPESKLIEEAAVVAVASEKKPKIKKSKKAEPVKHAYRARPEEVKNGSCRTEASLRMT